MWKLLAIIVILIGAIAPLQSYGRNIPVQIQSNDCTLHGTLTLPIARRAIPLVIFIAGAGDIDRNGNTAGMINNHLQILADSLIKYGIATLRYDKRGTGESLVNNKNDVSFDDHIHDAKLWASMMAKDRRFKEIIIFGHNEGALIGSIIAQNSKIKKLIVTGNTALSMGNLLRRQLANQPEEVKNISYDIISQLENGKQVKDVDNIVYYLFHPKFQPYLISEMKYNPANEFSKLKIPALIVRGGTDIFMKEEDVSLLEQAYPDSKVVRIPNMMYVLKECRSLDRYLQYGCYTNPSLPVHTDLVKAIKRFVLNKYP